MTDTIATLRERYSAARYEMETFMGGTMEFDCAAQEMGVVAEALLSLCDRLSAGAGEPYWFVMECPSRPPEFYKTRPVFVPPISTLTPLFASAPADGQAALLVREARDALQSLLHPPVHELLPGAAKTTAAFVVVRLNAYLLAAQPGKKL